MNRCEQFARLIAKQAGMSYAQATKIYWRRNNKEVWINGYQTVKSHCVHCARADAISKYGKKGKLKR